MNAHYKSQAYKQAAKKQMWLPSTGCSKLQNKKYGAFVIIKED